MGKSLEQVISEHWDSDFDGMPGGQSKCDCGHVYDKGYSDELAHQHLRDKIHMWMMAALIDPNIVGDCRFAIDQWEDDGGWAHPADAAVAEFLAWMVSEDSVIDGTEI